MSQPQPHILRAIQGSIMLNSLYKIIGYDAMIALVKKWGGRRLYVPLDYKGIEHPIVKCIGIDAAKTLSWKHAVEHISVPTMMIIENAKRDKNIADWRKKGRTVEAISKKFKIGERRVRDILVEQETPCCLTPVTPTRPNRQTRKRQHEALTGQMDLFPKV
jgi:Mor family transcriptional regulator